MSKKLRNLGILLWILLFIFIHYYHDNPYGKIYQNPMVDEHVPHSKGPKVSGYPTQESSELLLSRWRRGNHIQTSSWWSLTVKTSPMWRFPEIGPHKNHPFIYRLYFPWNNPNPAIGVSASLMVSSHARSAQVHHHDDHCGGLSCSFWGSLWVRSHLRCQVGDGMGWNVYAVLYIMQPADRWWY